jgi:hypothetical protein
MKKQLFILPFVIFTCINAFAQNSSYSIHIPQNASTVTRINLPSIIKKVGPGEIIKKIMLASGKKEAMEDNLVTEIIKDPSRSGIAFNKEIWVMDNKLYAYDSTGYSMIIGSIADTFLFRKLFTSGKKKRVIKYQSRQYLVIDADKNAAISWDEHFFVYTRAKEARAIKLESYLNNDDELSKKKPVKKINYSQLAAARSKAVLKGFSNNPVMSDSIFNASLSNDGDVVIWNKQSDNLGILKGLKNIGISSPMPEMFGLSNKNTEKKGKSSVNSIRFENGKVSMTGTSQLADSVAVRMKKMLNSGISSKLTQHILPGNILGWMSMNFKLNELEELLNTGKMRSMLDGMLAKNNLTFDEISKAFSGDAMLVFMAPDKLAEGERPKPRLYFAAGIQDRICAEKILRSLDDTKAKKEAERKEAEMKEEKYAATSTDSVRAILDSLSANDAIVLTDTVKAPVADSSITSAMDTVYTAPPPPPSIAAFNPLAAFKTVRSLNDDVLVIAGKQEFADRIAGNKNGADISYLDKEVLKSPFVFYLDIQSVCNMMMQVEKPKTEKDKNVAEMLKAFKKLVIYSANMTNNSIDTKMELQMTDANTNSLDLLMDIILDSILKKGKK